MHAPSSIEAALANIRARIVRAAENSGRDSADITLVAVSKTHPTEAILAALNSGQTIFGENRVQEAAAKFPTLRQHHPSLRLHLIGPLQTNKVHNAIGLADVIETLDRPRLADAIETEAVRAGRLPELLIQVNIGNEPQKAGIPTADAPPFIRACITRFGASLRGLMCIPPAGQDPAPFFQTLAALRTAHELPVLSMGMSADFETAVAYGATHIRVGSAIFGARQ